jgi:quaternary ammonium compound-resistance protein SugE
MRAMKACPRILMRGDEIALTCSRRIFPQNAGMAWTYLILAGLLEIGWAVGLKYTAGFSKLGPSVITVLLMVASFALLAQAVKVIPLGTAYAVWTGIGAAGAAVIGMMFFQESREAVRIACLLLIVAGVVGLKWFAPPSR